MANGIKEKIEDANEKAIDKVLTSNPILVDVKPAIEVVPGMKKNMIHACRSSNRLAKYVWTHEGSRNGNFAVRRSCQNERRSC